ncbi:MAG: FAD:protein FMN transferase [Actinomycetia bacterium]|nr:FAD:protein FMN transferase [Actinomycetes bacterium]
MAGDELRGRAMASEVLIRIEGGGAGLAERAFANLEALETRWTRFRPQSEISRLNSARGAPVEVSPETATLVATMITAHRLTGGRFDPSQLPALLRAGYRASIHDAQLVTELPPGCPSHDVQGIRFDRPSGTIQLPVGLALDPGGLGKGLAADLLAGRLVAEGATAALVSVGGDLALAGQPIGGTWPIGIEHGHDSGLDSPRQAVILTVDRGGVATSSTRSRRWFNERGEHHHTIDPETERPAVTDLVSSTVVAGSAWWAEVLATASLTAGSDQGWQLLTDHQVEGVLQDESGSTHFTAGLAMSALAPEPMGARR